MHEQSRWDRDQYLTVDLTKVDTSMRYNYNKYEKEENDNYGKQYDYGGNMHYKDNDMAKGAGDIVMIAKNPAYQMSIGGAIGPVFGDVYEMNMQYKCYEGMKFCCKEQFNQTMTTASNLLVIQAYNSFYYTTFSVQYKL
uniref:Metalloendopeptidase n=1 Tax=Steinernema glaseri TaxID=37863 RepID=A0A1I8A026_9BILA